MSINYAILGMLSIKPMTGYDLKKIIQESPFMHWSGNNNQIYKALLELNDQGYVTNEVQHLEKSPSKKVYTITEDGLYRLKKWTQTSPDAPEYKNLFLVQLAFSDMLNTKEISDLLETYEQRIRGQIAMQQTTARKTYFAPNRTSRETALWELIYDNILAAYLNELKWVAEAREKLAAYPDIEDTETSNEMEETAMIYTLIEDRKQRYILLDAKGKLIESEQDGLDLVAICAQNDTHNLMIQGEQLSDSFLQLSTGLAGSILQKLTNYGIKTVIVLDEERAKGKFKELIAESNRGTMFRAYGSLTAAKEWLLS